MVVTLPSWLWFFVWPILQGGNGTATIRALRCVESNLRIYRDNNFQSLVQYSGKPTITYKYLYVYKQVYNYYTCSIYFFICVYIYIAICTYKTESIWTCRHMLFVSRLQVLGKQSPSSFSSHWAAVDRLRASVVRKTKCWAGCSWPLVSSYIYTFIKVYMYIYIYTVYTDMILNLTIDRFSDSKSGLQRTLHLDSWNGRLQGFQISFNMGLTCRNHW